ncbi:hypothetical protein SERLA73DRAFT_78208 [Serpula lacrymans var. lacrymans S7.3]|uniref:BZIP domain-containing protein n=2 Tax=Serpula lacrymans var. lacrymans TaxID=341189 RepID=F8QCG8_SERL3|nr:uncharacterized protein SERLADRAFT_453708 [Serpula lacrymans var. lacrymans S7.9]EGN93833.1 hypothetical protein SERLA73DRAFT_78208 [Serpula lacrymans var. lacrymans S7.3]EGO19201.1 hypothetical protein SERLADRAFT_453708 [Serpula lacrymans var. lacrymans S7.9]
MVPVGPLPPQASSSTLWATASKEWVIPAKPKPGRKPKKDTMPVVPQVITEDEDVDSSGRRVQNRAAQRAFRERKQTQLAELQARLQSYEQGEIKRNVALQNIAKRLKDENEELRKENSMLKERVERLENERVNGVEMERKRYGDEAADPSSCISPETSRKRAKLSADPPTIQLSGASYNSYSSTSSMIPSPSSVDSDNALSAMAVEHQTQDLMQPMFQSPSPSLVNVLDFSSHSKPDNMEHQSSLDSYRCMLCSTDMPCVCRDIAIQSVQNGQMGMPHSDHVSLEVEKYQSHVNSTIAQPIPIQATMHPQMSILENLPSYQAPVPIRRRSNPNGNTLFSLLKPSHSQTSAKCSGDPANCMACADDTFGKAFCSAIGQSVASKMPCINCPGQADDGSGNSSSKVVIAGCCGDISKCGSCGIAPMASSAPQRLPGPETIATDDAWRQLKSHPNVAFTDLSLLAEVVARRSRCTGPRVTISPAPGSITPERSSLQAEAYMSHSPREAEHSDQSILLTDPHEQYHQKRRSSAASSPPPRLVPQEILIECGRRRMREVHAEGVREALRLLDSKFAHARP